MRKYNRYERDDEDEDEDEQYDHGEDLDWSELGSLHMHMGEAATSGLNFTMLGCYARDARRGRRKSRRRS